MSFNAARVAATFWTLLIFAALAMPSGSVPESGLSFADKVIHFGLFAAFGALWMHALLTRRAGPPSRAARTACVVLFWGTIYGIALEVFQGFLPALGRSAELLDALADVLGLLAAIGAYALWHRRQQ